MLTQQSDIPYTKGQISGLDQSLLADPGIQDYAADVDNRMGVGIFRSPRAPIPLRPALLEAAAHDDLIESAKRVRRLIRGVCGDPGEDGSASLAHRVNHTPPGFSLWTEDPSQNRFALHMCRPDFIFSGGIPKLMEINVNSAIGGVPQLAKLNQIYWSHPSVSDAARSVPMSSLDPGSALSRMLEDIGRVTDVAYPRIALIGYRSHVDDFGHEIVFSEIIKTLRTNGFPTVYAYPEDLHVRDDGRAYIGNLRIDIAVRTFVTADAPEAGIDLTGLRTVIDEKAALVLSPESAEPYASKRVLAWLTRNSNELPSSDRRFIERHIPATYDLGDLDSLPGTTESAKRQWLCSQRPHLVLKGYQGHSGANVHVGRTTAPKIWEELVESALSTGRTVAQEFVEPDVLTLPVYDETEAAPLSRSFKTVFSPLLLGDWCGGILVRQMPDSSGDVVNAYGGGAANMAFRSSQGDRFSRKSH
ncbi:hypothetical protein ACFQZ2_00280 [Streptomonospora algeriensis]|uniref:Circularly permuted ATPgrasp domain-containing protein n=1 Tax=Streptomonospora algeriensis TaxID=995084 RepID=A0ABW3BAF7_9ACTN